jgi:hypothetical protein
MNKCDPVRVEIEDLAGTVGQLITQLQDFDPSDRITISYNGPSGWGADASILITPHK